ncbi:hypothetical protein [Poseidonibacter antarcticus]|uniref:hypothetical protein n=1 Tax=Poseidonibacter antarcticus TaxID=2478538 RepID=UPI000EF46EBF|nr:hypothetical protein [Poseidonibacter antarcticus]
MENIAKNSEIKSILVGVSEKIRDKNILNFAITSLDLNNIEHSPNDKIYCTFLKHSNQYQIFVFDNSFKYMIFELIYDENPNDDNTFTLYITKDFFVIFNDNHLYTYQKINQQYSKEELIEYISKSFNITITKVKEIDEIRLHEIMQKKEPSIDISYLQNINIKGKKSFYFYLFYLLICVLSMFIYKNYEEENFNKQNLHKLQESKEKYFKILKVLKYAPFEIEYTKLIQTIKELDLKLISFSFTSKNINIKVSSNNKDNIYLLLNHYRKSLLGNSIRKSDSSENIFIGVLNVKINR